MGRRTFLIGAVGPGAAGLAGWRRMCAAADMSGYAAGLRYPLPTPAFDRDLVRYATLWSDANIDVIGIDNDMPLPDWRDGFDPADAALAPAIYDRACPQSNITGGEGFDCLYGSPADRAAQIRPAITDGAATKPWVFRFKDLRASWQNPHFNRPGGIESGTPTAWVPQSKPIWSTELG